MAADGGGGLLSEAGAGGPTPCYLPCDFVEAQGLDVNFFQELWCDHPRAVRLAHEMSELKVPHTVVFAHNVPFGWYFTSIKDRAYMRRNKKRLHHEEIYRLMSPVGESGIAAQPFCAA